MKNQFLKMAFMAMCLSMSSSVYAMNPETEFDEEGIPSHAAALLKGSPYGGKYGVVRNTVCEVNNGYVLVEQDNLRSLVIRNFKLTCGRYFDHMQKLKKDMQEKKADCAAERQRMADFKQNDIEAREAYIDENLRIVDFVLNALPETSIKLTVLAEDDKGPQYGGVVQHHGKDLNVRFCVNKSSESDVVTIGGSSPYYNNTELPAEFSLIIQSPYHHNTAEFSLIKEGSRRYLTREWRQFWDHREMRWR